MKPKVVNIGEDGGVCYDNKRKHDDISRFDDPTMEFLEAACDDGTNAPCTYEEFADIEKEIEEFLSHPPGWDDPNTYKKQSEEVCEECFPIIQEKWPEMSDYELVESMGASFFLTWSGFAHLNLKAKQKGAPDSSTTTYYVEFDITNREILRFCEILIDSSSGYNLDCPHCPERADAITGYVYHPKDTSSGY